MKARMVLESRPTKHPNNQKGLFIQKTALGWTAIGCLPRFQPTRNESCHTQELEKLLRDFFEVATFVKPSITTRTLSNDEQRAMDILESTTRNVNRRYEVGLLWRENNFAIPNNRPIALQRLFSNERRFKSDPDYAQKYAKIINEYIQLGFARKLETNELEGRIHQIVNFGVENPNKSGKLRVVFHASLKYKGTALNDPLSSGPDMLTNLTGVLIRFARTPSGYPAKSKKCFTKLECRLLIKQCYVSSGGSQTPITRHKLTRCAAKYSERHRLQSAAPGPSGKPQKINRSTAYIIKLSTTFTSTTTLIPSTKSAMPLYSVKG